MINQKHNTTHMNLINSNEVKPADKCMYIIFVSMTVWGVDSCHRDDSFE